TPSILRSLLSVPTSPPDFYTLSLHDALPIYASALSPASPRGCRRAPGPHESSGRAGLRVLPSAPRDRPAIRPRGFATALDACRGDRKSTRLNSSHVEISYAVFCLKKKMVNGE